MELVKDLNPADYNSGQPDELAAVGNKLFFSADPGGGIGREPHVSDGTEAGTKLLKDITPSGSSTIDSFTDLNGVAFFEASYPFSEALWKSDGTEAGTLQIPGVVIWNDQREVLGDWMYFSGQPHGATPQGRELWRTNGTTTEQFANIGEDNDLGGVTSGDPNTFRRVGNLLYFTAVTDLHGRELWVTNGVNVTLVQDIAPGDDPNFSGVRNSSAPKELAAVGDWLYLLAHTPGEGFQLWKTQGFGATLVDPIIAGPSDGSARALTGVGNTLFFTATITQGLELWKSDGTDETTFQVEDINPGGANSDPQQFVDLGGVAYFTADRAGNGREIWKSDGTPEGTDLVVDINGTAEGGAPGQLLLSDGELVFHGDSGLEDEMWRSDGTAAGTGFIEDFEPGSLQPFRLMDVQGTVFFQGFSDAETGYELWRTTDGDVPPVLPTVSIADPAPIKEGNAANKLQTFTVTLSAPSSDEVQVSYATADGKAKAGKDYVAVTDGELAFAPGITTRTFNIEILGGKRAEGKEKFFVNLSAPINATILRGQAVATIKDND